jgi:predicted RNase H-like nuclease (RuvC/YqgF family)
VRRPKFGHREQALEQRLERQHQRIADLERELIRLAPQVAALEQRLEDLREASDATHLEATDEERVESRALLEDIRREHARVRARISAATIFEERLRVVEEHLGIDSATGRRKSPE